MNEESQAKQKFMENLAQMPNRKLLEEFTSHQFMLDHMKKNHNFEDALGPQSLHKALQLREEYIGSIKLEILKRMEAYNAKK